MHCWEKRTQYLKQKKEKATIEKLCQVCSKPLISGRLCKDCRTDARQKNKDRSLIRQELNLCVLCGKEKFRSPTRCLTCYLKDIAHYHFGKRNLYPQLIDIFNKQEGICPYTGEKLILGENTTLDHKIPSSRGGSNDISNLQWIYKGRFDVNWMKGMMLEEEFFQAIETIYHFIKPKMEEHGDSI